MAEHREHFRFTVPQRIEHWVQMLSFTGLVVTGIPQKFAGDAWAEALIRLMGGIEIVRIIHHTSAVVMALAAIYHVIAVAYKVFVLRVRWTMFPRLDDVLDALDAIRHNLGLTKEHPKFGRYNFGEKFEYWAFVWGAVIMGVTGFIMWNPINAARFLPGELIPAAKAAHGAEAILAALAILIWHFYNVHIKTFNKAIFTGKLNERQMAEEHALELQQINEGRVDVRPAPEIVKKRERVFIPVAAIASAAMLVILFLFVTYEETALATVPRRVQPEQIFVPLTPTPLLRPAPAGTPAPGGITAAKPLPANHAGRTTCNNCHANNIGPQNPPDHAGRSDATCAACHKVGSAPTPSSSSSGAGVAKALPANHAGRTVCNACHENNIGPKNPADHAGRTDAICTTCHKVP